MCLGVHVLGSQRRGLAWGWGGATFKHHPVPTDIFHSKQGRWMAKGSACQITEKQVEKHPPLGLFPLPAMVLGRCYLGPS
jgi:hypothetical protein